MRLLFPAIVLSMFVVGCPQPVEGPMGAVQPTNAPPANQQPEGGPIPSAPSGSLPPPTLIFPINCRRLREHRVFRLTNCKRPSVHSMKMPWMSKRPFPLMSRKNGRTVHSLSTTAMAALVTAQFVRTHDPVRFQGLHRSERLSGCRCRPNALYQLAFG